MTGMRFSAADGATESGSIGQASDQNTQRRGVIVAIRILLVAVGDVVTDIEAGRSGAGGRQSQSPPGSQGNISMATAADGSSNSG